MTRLFSYSFDAMGGAANLHLYAEDEAVAAGAADEAIREIERIEQRYSRYRPDSLLSGINRTGAEGGRIAVDAETAALLDYAYACHTHSGGLFDISAGVLREAWDFGAGSLPEAADLDALRARVGLDKLRWHRPSLEFTRPGMELDFGGIAKEYAADRAARICRDNGIHGGLVELSGDIAVIGPHPDGSLWEIGIRHPRDPEALAGTVSLGSGGLAGSGDYARCIELEGVRYAHILDPVSGWPVQGLAAVNVAAESCMVAGSVSTIAMLKGTAGADWLRQLGVAHLWIDVEGRQGGPLLGG